MKRRSFIKLSSYMLAGSILPKTTLTLSDHINSRPLIMGIFPRRNIKLTYKLFSPMATYLSHSLQREVRLVTAKNFKDFWRGVKEQRYDLVHYNQYHYIVSNLLYGYQVILKNQEFGRSTNAATIIVRKDSNINSISDLKNKTILFGGGKMAMQSYISIKWLLQKEGLTESDYNEKIAINPPNAIMSTYQKQADAAGSGDTVIKLDVVKRNIDITQMKFLAKTKQLPHLPWAVKSNMPEQLKQSLQSILSSLHSNPSGRNILNQAKLSALVSATDKDYDEHRKIVRDVYGDDYGINLLK